MPEPKNISPSYRLTHPPHPPTHACAGTAIFTFPGGVELKEAFKAQLDDVGRQLSEEEVQAVRAVLLPAC